jgi:hypothetical protein
VKSDTKASSDKEVDIVNFVDDKPSWRLERPVKMSRDIAESNEGEEIDFEDRLTYQKTAKKQASKSMQRPSLQQPKVPPPWRGKS